MHIKSKFPLLKKMFEGNQSVKCLELHFGEKAYDFYRSTDFSGLYLTLMVWEDVEFVVFFS